MTIMQKMVEQGSDVGQLERMIALVERWQDRNAQADFAAALNRFQSLCPTVFKGRATKEGSSGFGYKFASFDDIMRAAAPALAECGISIGFDTTQDLEKGLLIVKCRIRVGSYYEDRTFACPVASSLKVSDAQKFGSALSYAKRYCLCAALNIVTTDHDDDGQGTIEFIDEDQVAALEAMIAEKNVDMVRFLKWAEIASLDRMLKTDFAKSKDMLVRKQRGAS